MSCIIEANLIFVLWFYLGESPPLPDSLTMDPNYSEMIKLFKMCTLPNYNQRPSAEQVLQFLGVY